MKLVKHQKPELAVLSDFKKIRVYSTTERLTISKNIVKTLLNKLGVSSKAETEHHLEAIRFISDNKEFTPEEFTKAFDLAIEGVLKIDLFQQVNCVVIGKVMNLYRNYKTENLRVYKSQMKALNQPKTPKMSENDRRKLFHRVIKDEFKNYKATGELNPMRNWIYDDLARFDVGITMALKKASWRIAQEDMKAEQSQYPVKDRLTESEFNAQSITRAKANLIATVFDKFTTFEQLKSKLNE